MYESFYKIHLQRVSRSFSFCIDKLDEPFRAWVGLSYLLCRILDTIEDAPWKSSEQQNKAYASFAALVDQKSNFCGKEFADLFPEEIPESEKLLVADTARCFELLREFPQSIQSKIERTLGNMQRGMKKYGNQGGEAASLRLKSLAELNEYCFYVAGVVGDLLTDLILELRPEVDHRNFRADAIHFGLFLQKVNVLKDQKEDEAAGRYLIPSRPQVLASLKENAEGAVRFLTALPVQERGFRLFCGWSLFLGLGSLAVFFTENPLLRLAKLPRAVTEFLLDSVEKKIDDNEALLGLFLKYVDKIPNIPVSLGSNSALGDLFNTYQGPLLREEFVSLKIIP